MRISDWSSDVCSSDLKQRPVPPHRDDDEPGRALPTEIVEVLDRNMTLLRPTFTAGHRVEGWSNDDYAVMWQTIDRKSVVWGKSVSVRVDLGGRRIIKKKII